MQFLKQIISAEITPEILSHSFLIISVFGLYLSFLIIFADRRKSLSTVLLGLFTAGISLLLFNIVCKGIIPGYLSHDGFNDLKNYLSEDVTQLKLFQLSTKIADLFDQYLVFRPQLIFQWEKAKEEKRQPDIWQAKLWRELVRGKEGLHRARLHHALSELDGAIRG